MKKPHKNKKFLIFSQKYQKTSPFSILVVNYSKLMGQLMQSFYLLKFLIFFFLVVSRFNDDDLRDLDGLYISMSSFKYGGARLFKHLKTVTAIL